jgi:hypothetical protein
MSAALLQKQKNRRTLLFFFILSEYGGLVKIYNFVRFIVNAEGDV